MQKQLNEMTNDELGKLFPIFIVEPDSRWPRLYCDEERKIKSTLGKQNVISISLKLHERKYQDKNPRPHG